MVADVEVEPWRLADLAEDDRVLVAGAVGRLRVGRIRDRRRQRRPVVLDRLELGLELLDPGRDLAHPRDRVVGVGSLALRRSDRVGSLVALGAQTLDRWQQIAAAGIELEQAVEVAIGADAGERGADRRRILADAPQVEQGSIRTSRSRSRASRRRSRPGRRPRARVVASPRPGCPSSGR